MKVGSSCVVLGFIPSSGSCADTLGRQSILPRAVNRSRQGDKPFGTPTRNIATKLRSMRRTQTLSERYRQKNNYKKHFEARLFGMYNDATKVHANDLRFHLHLTCFRIAATVVCALLSLLDGAPEGWASPKPLICRSSER
eukprot:1186372-Prorocentrum_minimum.AAC.4